MILSQFFGRPFVIVFGAQALVFGLALVAFQTVFAPVLLAVLGALAFALTLKRLEWGMAAAFAELFANAHGHLVSADVAGFAVSLRMAVFLGVMSAFALRVAFKPEERHVCRDPRLVPFLLLAAAVGIGVAVGFAQNDPRTAFADGNAYLYALYLLPALALGAKSEAKRLLLQTLAASAAWVAFQTLALLYVFTHVPTMFLAPVYTFIRDTRTGELTQMYGSIFRIFLQAQFSVYVLALFLLPFAFLRLEPRPRRALFAAQAIAAATAIIGLSRSFWVGFVAAGAAAVLLFASGVRAPNAYARGIGLHALAGAAGAALLVLVMLFPFPPRTGSVGDLASLFTARTTDTDDVAISSRWNLLPPLLEEIKASPILGSGFGETVTFVTDDPRARAIHPDGTWTTYALEWGWLDTWLKTGVLGLVAFAWIAYALIRGLLPHLKTDRAWLAVGGIASLIFLYATHAFSPYLNHPLGIGLLVFLTVFSIPRPRVAAAVKEETLAPAKMPAQASVAASISE